jgi:hypothetical protein
LHKYTSKIHASLPRLSFCLSFWFVLKEKRIIFHPAYTQSQFRLMINNHTNCRILGAFVMNPNTEGGDHIM